VYRDGTCERTVNHKDGESDVVIRVLVVYHAAPVEDGEGGRVSGKRAGILESNVGTPKEGRERAATLTWGS
jgi:hypothetical protein